VRVVQKEEYEDSNMLKVSWVWSWEGVTHQVELRHGRRSGIRKVYVDRQLLERQKSMKNMVSDVGSQHEFMVGNRRAEVLIVPKAGSAGYLYQIKIDGQAIEQNMVPPGPTCSNLSPGPSPSPSHGPSPRPSPSPSPSSSPSPNPTQVSYP
jgi:hypothetical protein